MTHRLWTLTSLASIVGFAWISGCADDPKRKPKPQTTATTGSGVTSNTGSTSGPGSNTNTVNTSSATSSGTTGSTTGTGGDGSGGTGTGGGAGDNMGGSAGDSGTGGDGTGGTGTGGDGTGGTGTGGDGTGGTGTGGDGTGGTGTGGTGTGGTGTGGTGTGGTGTGGTGGTGTGGTGTGGTGGMGEGGQGGASPCEMSLLDTCGFETATTEGWVARGSVTLTPTTDDAYEGDYSLAVTNRSDTWHGVQYNVLGLLEAGVAYQATVYAKLISGGPTRLTFTRQLNCGSGDTYPWIANMNNVEVATGWIELTGTITLAEDCAATGDLLYVEAGESGTAEYYIDEPLLIEQ